MPSDERSERALEALAEDRDRFHTAVATAVDQVHTFLSSHRSPENGRSDRVAAELGRFAATRVDPDRFAAVFVDSEALDAETLARVETAAEVLEALGKDDPTHYTATVPEGGDLRDTVVDALARSGRAFGAARVIDLARTGRYDGETHAPFLESFPSRMWNRAEREIAPPLVVEVDGADLRVGGLAEFLDGMQKIVLLVRGHAPPAALVRLITPGVCVMQTSDAAALDRLGAFRGPGIAAVVPESAARFVHDPAGGPTPARRLQIDSVPGEPPKKPIGRLTIFQQTQELEQLRALTAAAQEPVAEEGEAAAKPSAAMPGDKLAAWLLRQANLD